MAAKKTTYTKDEVLETSKQENVRFIRLMFSDINGIPKNIEVPVERLEEVLETGVQFDASSIAGFAEIHESDMILKPDASTFSVLPWSTGDGKSARLICDVYKPDGTRYDGDPRYVLQRMIKKAEEMGYSMSTGPECEFFLFKLDEKGNPTAEPHDAAGYFDMGQSDFGEKVRKDVTLHLEQMGFNIEASHHEVAPGQHEVDFNYGDALTTADRVLTLKWVTKVVARQHGLHASFMPKPVFGVNGSGMHMHMSLWKGSENAFFDPDGRFQMSDTAYHALGGILEHVSGVTAVLNSTVNSYKRLVPGYEAPCYMAWANKNRSALIRVPAARGKGTRLELRSPDPAGNPYLQSAAVLAAALEGVRNKTTPPDPVEQDIYHMTPAERRKAGISALPGSLSEALNALQDSKVARDLLGDHILDQFLTLKGKEADAYRIQVHPWELDAYLPSA